MFAAFRRPLNIDPECRSLFVGPSTRAQASCLERQPLLTFFEEDRAILGGWAATESDRYARGAPKFSSRDPILPLSVEHSFGSKYSDKNARRNGRSSEHVNTCLVRDAEEIVVVGFLGIGPRAVVAVGKVFPQKVMRKQTTIDADRAARTPVTPIAEDA